MTFKKPKPIYVRWLDHFTDTSGWSTMDEETKELTEEDFTVETCGWLIAETKKYYKIAMNIGSHNEVNQTIAILKADVVKATFPTVRGRK